MGVSVWLLFFFQTVWNDCFSSADKFVIISLLVRAT